MRTHPRAAVVLLAKAGTDRPIEQRFHFGPPEHSDHGSPSWQDSRVPLIVASPTRSGAAIRRTVRGVLGRNPSQLGFDRLMRRLVGK